MYPQRVAGATDRPMTLVPLYDRGAHHDTCPFARSRPEHADTPWLVPRNAPKGLGVLSVLKAAENAVKRDSRLQKGLAGNKRLPSLAGVLFKVLEAAGLNRVSVTKRSVSSDKGKLRDVLASLSLDGYGKIPAETFVRLSFRDFAKVEHELAALQGVTWPGKLHPQGLLIEQIQDIEVRADGSKWLIPTYGDPLEVVGRLYLPGAGTLGPYLAIALVAILPGQSHASIHRAYVHPLYSFDEWLPVDSDLERKTLSILTAKLQFQAKQANNPYEIEKPLLDIVANAQLPKSKVRPDFLVISNGKKLVVETMGYIDPDYLERKERTHALMAHIGRVIKHETGGDAVLRSKLLDFVSRR
jgi:hypothetical protein